MLGCLTGKASEPCGVCVDITCWQAKCSLPGPDQQEMQLLSCPIKIANKFLKAVQKRVHLSTHFLWLYVSSSTWFSQHHSG